MNDRDWLAARYVLGELDETEVSRCEEWLASDQTFREAVANAVELLAATRHVYQTSPPSVRKSERRRKIWWGVGIVSGVAATTFIGASVWIGQLDRSVAVLPAAPATESFVSDQMTGDEAVEVAREWVDQQVDHREGVTSTEDESFNWIDESFDRSDESFLSDWVSEAAKLDPES
ncbi:hypothetical protein K2Y11_10310 [bacterium]|nr:hypothetical protein [bacterium]